MITVAGTAKRRDNPYTTPDCPIAVAHYATPFRSCHPDRTDLFVVSIYPPHLSPHWCRSFSSIWLAEVEWRCGLLRNNQTIITVITVSWRERGVGLRQAAALHFEYTNTELSMIPIVPAVWDRFVWLGLQDTTNGTVLPDLFQQMHEWWLTYLASSCNYISRHVPCVSYESSDSSSIGQ